MLTFNFEIFPAQVNVESGSSPYADCINHCRDYTTYKVAGDQPSSAHECTHGINADIRNAHGGNVNGFYCLKDRAAVVPEPPFRKPDIVAYIPEAFRKGRYALYITGQTAWDGLPLYVYDEWSAYINGASAAVALGKTGELQSGSDWVYGPLEFIAYGLAVAMTAAAKNCLSAELASFTRVQLRRAFNVFLEGKAIFPFEGQDQLYQELKDGPAGADYRAFMKDRLAFVVPDTVQPEDEDGPGHNDFLLI